MEQRLGSYLNMPAIITLTDNKRSMISVRCRDHVYHIRLHHVFLWADEGILRALADYISGNSKKNLGIIRDYIRKNRFKIRRKPVTGTRKFKIRHQGRFFNLFDSFTNLNERYFEGEIDSSITWGKRLNHSRYRLIRLGSYSPSSNIIRINPILDREFVPQYVIDSITYHEMLHRFLGFKHINGRRLSHYDGFKEMERNFIHSDRAKVWLKKNFDHLTGKS